MLGRLYMQRSETPQAIEWLEQAAEEPAPTPADGRALLYDLGVMLDGTGETHGRSPSSSSSRLMPATIGMCPRASTASRACRAEADHLVFVRLLFAAYFLETGLILVVMPWSTFWDRNIFVATLPVVERLLASPYARGAVSGVGVITAIAGVLELAAAFGAWRTAGADDPKPGL